MNIIEFEYDGKSYEVDADQAKSYAVIRGLALAEKDLPGFFNAMALLFNGKDIEYCDAVGGMDKMGGLIAKACEVAQSKNS